MPWINFQDGPCENRNMPITQAQVGTGQVACGGAIYDIVPQSGGYVGYVHTSQSPGGIISSFAPDILHGYDDLKHSIIKRLWPAMQTANRNNAAALRALARRPKVKRR